MICINTYGRKSKNGFTMYVREGKEVIDIVVYNNKRKKHFFIDANKIDELAVLIAREMFLNTDFFTATLQTEFAHGHEYTYIHYYDGKERVAMQRYFDEDGTQIANKVMDVIQKIKESGAQVIYTSIGAIEVKGLYL